MIRTWIGLGLAALTALSAAAPALATHNGETAPPGCRYIRGMGTPEDHSDDVYVCKRDVWFHKASTRVGNLAAVGQDTIPSWNATPPAGTLQDSSAIYVPVVAYDVAVAQDPMGRSIFRGTFTGPLDTLAFRMHLRAPIQEADSSDWPAFVHLAIDGETVYSNYDSAAVGMPLKPAGDNLRRVDGVFTNLYETMKSLGLDVSATKEHQIEIAMAPWYIVDSHTVFFYDAADAASGLTFNYDGSLTGYTRFELVA